MAYLSKVSYVASAGQTNFGLTFPYLLKSHVTVRVNGVPAAFTWFNATTIALTTPAALNDVVLIQRSSGQSARLNDYSGGSVLTEAVMDLDANQILYIAQEAIDLVADLSARVDQFSLGGVAPLAANIASSPTGNVTATNVQAALGQVVAKAGGTMTGPLILSADPAVALAAATKQYVDQSVFSGLIGISLSATAPTGWLNLQGGTVGNATSSATVRANADTAGLFAYLWNNLSDTLAPVSGGRGANAAADFAANKAITLPDLRNRKPMGAGQSTVVEAFTQAAVNVSTDTISVLSNDRKWQSGQQAVLNILTGSLTGTGISNGATVYVIRTGPTGIKLATSLLNSQNGIAIDLTAVGGSSTFTLVATFTSRTVGETGGEEWHATTLNELLAHSHLFSPSISTTTNPPGSFIPGFQGDSGSKYTTQLAGGNQAFNVLDPFFCVNWIIKL